MGQATIGGSELQVFTIKEVAKLLKVDHKVVRNSISNGELEAFKVGRQWRIRAGALLKYTGAA